MDFLRAVLTPAAMQPDMGTETVSVNKNLHGIAGYSHIHFALDVLKRNRIILLVHSDVIIERNRRNLPCRQLERVQGQRQKIGLLFGKPCRTAAVFLLKSLVVKGTEPLPDDRVKLFQREKLLIPDCRQYE